MIKDNFFSFYILKMVKWGAFQIVAPVYRPVGGHSDPYRNSNGLLRRCWPLLVADQQRQFEIQLTGKT